MLSHTINAAFNGWLLTHSQHNHLHNVPHILSLPPFRFRIVPLAPSARILPRFVARTLTPMVFPFKTRYAHLVPHVTIFITRHINVPSWRILFVTVACNVSSRTRRFVIYVEQVQRISHGLGHIVVLTNLGRWYRVQKLIGRWVDVSLTSFSISPQNPITIHLFNTLSTHSDPLFLHQSRPFTTEYQVLFPGGSSSVGIRHHPPRPFLFGHLQTGQDVLNTDYCLDIAHIAFWV